MRPAETMPRGVFEVSTLLGVTTRQVKITPAASSRLHRPLLLFLTVFSVTETAITAGRAAFLPSKGTFHDIFPSHFVSCCIAL